MGGKDKFLYHSLSWSERVSIKEENINIWDKHLFIILNAKRCTLYADINQFQNKGGKYVRNCQN